MNPNKERVRTEPARHSPFWVCLGVFVLLAGDYGLRLVNVVEQRRQLTQARLAQTQNLGALAEARQVEARLEALSLDLLQIASTNAVAQQIVRDFNIRWTPGPATGPAPAPAASPPATIPAPPTGTNQQQK